MCLIIVLVVHSTNLIMFNSFLMDWATQSVDDFEQNTNIEIGGPLKILQDPQNGGWGDNRLPISSSHFL